MTAAFLVVRHFDQWDADMEAKFDEAAGMMHGLYFATLQAHRVEMPAADDDEKSE